MYVKVGRWVCRSREIDLRSVSEQKVVKGVAERLRDKQLAGPDEKTECSLPT